MKNHVTHAALFAIALCFVGSQDAHASGDVKFESGVFFESSDLWSSASGKFIEEPATHDDEGMPDIFSGKSKRRHHRKHHPRHHDGDRCKWDDPNSPPDAPTAPTPGALPAGLVLLGIAAARRR